MGARHCSLHEGAKPKKRENREKSLGEDGNGGWFDLKGSGGRNEVRKRAKLILQQMEGLKMKNIREANRKKQRVFSLGGEGGKKKLEICSAFLKKKWWGWRRTCELEVRFSGGGRGENRMKWEVRQW